MNSTEGWERNGDKYKDELQLYLTSSMYDCSLNVGTENTYQVFYIAFLPNWFYLTT